MPAENSHPGLPDFVPTGDIAGALRRAAVGVDLIQLLAGAEEVIDGPGFIVPLGGWQHGAGFFKQILVVENGDGSDVIGHAINAAFMRVGFDGELGELCQVVVVRIHVGLEIEQKVIFQKLR